MSINNNDTTLITHFVISYHFSHQKYKVYQHRRVSLKILIQEHYCIQLMLQTSTAIQWTVPWLQLAWFSMSLQYPRLMLVSCLFIFKLGYVKVVWIVKSKHIIAMLFLNFQLMCDPYLYYTNWFMFIFYSFCLETINWQKVLNNMLHHLQIDTQRRAFS